MKFLFELTMSISVKAIIYHRKKQIQDIERIASEMTPGSDLHVITSEKHAKKLKSDIFQRNLYRTGGNYVENDASICLDCEVIRNVNIRIHASSDENELISYLKTELLEAAESEDIESTVLDIDMSCATPWESVAICKFSAAINVRMYMSHGKRRRIAAFPRHLDLDESEMAVLKDLGKMDYFTRDDVIEVLRRARLPYSGTSSHRVIGSLGEKKCIRELRGTDYPGERSNHGGNRTKYYRVVDESWMMERINGRSVGTLEESISETVPGDDDWKIPDE